MAHFLLKEETEVLFEESLGVRKVILNRPTKLNSLNYGMLNRILKEVQDYEKDPTVNIVILKGNGRAFCAGGDLRAAFYYLIEGHWRFGATFFKRQYTLDYILGTYNRPLVALINGNVMGGGAGISMHARFRIVTENTVFAMPEAAIGHFPDVGASHFLSRLPGFFGEYIGLTGARLDGSMMLECGLATHFVPSKDLDKLEDALSLVAASDEFDISLVYELIQKFSQKVESKQDSMSTRLDIINKTFSKETVEEILSSLENFAAEKWIMDAIKSIKTASPTSLKIFLRSIREGRMQNLEHCLVREYNIARHIIRRIIGADVYEGMRALIIDKDKQPKWFPSQLELVSRELVNKFFIGVDDEEWKPLKLPERSNLAGTNLSRL